MMGWERCSRNSLWTSAADLHARATNKLKCKRVVYSFVTRNPSRSGPSTFRSRTSYVQRSNFLADALRECDSPSRRFAASLSNFSNIGPVCDVNWRDTCIVVRLIKFHLKFHSSIMYANYNAYSEVHFHKYSAITDYRSPSEGEDKDSTLSFFDVMLKIPHEIPTINFVTNLLQSHLDHAELLMLDLMNLRSMVYR